MISLTVPPDPGSLTILRSTAAAIAARAQLTLDQVEDVRMAIEEAARLLLPCGLPITMTGDPDGRPFVVEVIAEGASQIEVRTESLAWMVLSGVTDQLDVTTVGERAGLRLRFDQVAARP